jgi:hypothetical protein
MKKLLTLSVAGLLFAGVAAQAGRAPLSPEGEPSTLVQKGSTMPQVQDYVTPGLVASAQAGADYLVYMQADATDDNADNGPDPGDLDPDDAGWDWQLTAFTHSASASATNTYGVTLMGLYNAYLLDPQPAYFTAMKDAADHIVTVGPPTLRFGPDMTFLLDFASLPGVVNPATYRNGALAIWNYRMGLYGTATAFAELLRDSRHGQGYDNGIIPWDISNYVIAVQKLHQAFPGNGYDLAADAMADVVYQDSYLGNPGYFDPIANQGWDPTWTNKDYWWYSIGIAGVIQSFCAANVHTDLLPGLRDLLLDCQHPNGAFSDQYGANAGDEDWQDTAYAVMALSSCTSGSAAPVALAASWLASTQDPVSGGFVWNDGVHNTEIGGECTAALAMAAGYSVSQSASALLIGEDNGSCPATTTVTYHLDGAASYRSVTVFVGYDAALVDAAVPVQLYFPASSQFSFYDNGAGVIEVTLAMLGNAPGTTSGSVDLFSVTFDALDVLAADNLTGLAINSVVMRDKFNGPIPVAGSAALQVQIDGQAPVLTSADFDAAPTTCFNADFVVNYAGTDNLALDHVEYNFDGGVWVAAGNSGSFTTDMFAPGDYNLADGPHVLNVRYVDTVCYSSTSIALNFSLDTAPPVAATNLHATPNTHSVDLTWNAGSGLDEYRLYRVKRVTYPYFYDYPNNTGGLPGPGTLVDTGIIIPAGDTSYSDDFGTEDFSTRGVYDYMLVAVDCVNPAASSNVASATNYFLGDWAAPALHPYDYDGAVCGEDLTALSGVYGLNSAAGVSDEIDIAPTSDMGPFGLPGPDGRINFEDLIILAINYRLGCFSPLTALPVDPLGKDAVVDQASGLELRMTPQGAALLLDGSAMGYSARLRTNRELVAADLSAGTVMHYQENGELVIDAIGMGTLLDETSVLSLDFAGEGAIELVSVDARDAFNRPLSLTVDLPPAVLPVAYELEPNYPNPFNPATTLRFALPHAGTVRVAVYNMLGQQVALLQDGSLEAGWHSLVFDASALSSGVYLTRMEAEGYSAMQKMLLVK